MAVGVLTERTKKRSVKPRVNFNEDTFIPRIVAENVCREASTDSKRVLRFQIVGEQIISQ